MRRCGVFLVLLLGAFVVGRFLPPQSFLIAVPALILVAAMTTLQKAVEEYRERFFLGLGNGEVSLWRGRTKFAVLAAGTVTMTGVARGNRIFLWATVPNSVTVLPLEQYLGDPDRPQGSIKWSYRKSLVYSTNPDYASRAERQAVLTDTRLDVFVDFPIDARIAVEAESSLREHAAGNHPHTSDSWWTR